METFRLLCHPESPSRHVRSVVVDLVRSGTELSLVYSVDVSREQIALPDLQTSERADGLWQHTCFEAFIRSGNNAYSEFNFSPSGQWAAYDFGRYREGMRRREMLAPAITLETTAAQIVLTAVFAISGLSGPLALSAVIEEIDGTKSYWALAHAPGRPDFHHAACFAAPLPAPRET